MAVFLLVFLALFQGLQAQSCFSSCTSELITLKVLFKASTYCSDTKPTVDCLNAAYSSCSTSDKQIVDLLSKFYNSTCSEEMKSSLAGCSTFGTCLTTFVSSLVFPMYNDAFCRETYHLNLCLKDTTCLTGTAQAHLMTSLSDFEDLIKQNCVLECPKLTSEKSPIGVITAQNVNEIQLNTFNKSIGSVVDIHCYGKRSLVGVNRITCQSNLTWDFPVKPKCITSCMFLLIFCF